MNLNAGTLQVSFRPLLSRPNPEFCPSISDRPKVELFAFLEMYIDEFPRAASHSFLQQCRHPPEKLSNSLARLSRWHAKIATRRRLCRHRRAWRKTAPR